MNHASTTNPSPPKATPPWPPSNTTSTPPPAWNPPSRSWSASSPPTSTAANSAWPSTPRQLKKHNETEARIASVRDYHYSGYYTQRERAALAWSEAITNIQQGHAPDDVFADLKLHFTDAEIVNLTLTITNINAWNRLQIALGEPVPRV